MNKNETVDLLAPSVEAGWRDDFVLELRLIGASGPVIADALAEVEDHCRESGQGAEDAFGPSVEYARALELPDESRWTPAQLLRTATILLLLVFGVNAGLAGAIALANDRRVEISVGLLISGGVSLAMMMLVFLLGVRLLRLVFAHPAWFAIGFAAAVTVVPLAGLPFRNAVLGSLPAGPTLAMGIIAVALAAAVAAIVKLAGKSLADPLVPPRSCS